MVFMSSHPVCLDKKSPLVCEPWSHQTVFSLDMTLASKNQVRTAQHIGSTQALAGGGGVRTKGMDASYFTFLAYLVWDDYRTTDHVTLTGRMVVFDGVIADG